jgi:hypothetical protein
MELPTIPPDSTAALSSSDFGRVAGAGLVDVATGETRLMTYLAGFGAVAWLPT